MRRPLLWGCVCLTALLAVYIRLADAPPWFCPETAVPEGSRVSVTGQVYRKENRVSYGKEYLLVYLRAVQFSEVLSDTSSEISSDISTDISNYNFICEIPAGEYVPGMGNFVSASGTLRGYSHATNPGEFDTADYYLTEHIAGYLREACITGESPSGWRVREWLYGLRCRFRERLYEALPQKEAALLAKMLLGDSSGLDEELRELYQRNGIAHILAISGLHISLLGIGLYKLLRRTGCPLWPAAILGAVCILGYGMMIGFPVAAARAVGMYLIRMAGEMWGKTYDMLTAMGVMLAFMACRNPRLLLNSGFLLSFGSVAGVGLLLPALSAGMKSVRRRPGEKSFHLRCRMLLQKIAQGFLVSMSILIFTLPVQLWFYYQIAVYSPFLNLLVLPCMSVLMAAGLCVILVPGITFPVPIIQGIFAWYEALCRAADGLPGQIWLTGRPAGWKVLLYYLCLGLLILILERRRRTEQKNRPYIRAAVLLCLAIFLGARHPAYMLHFLDVGQGDCICLMTETGRVFLFDGGSSSRTGIGERVIVPFLKYYGVGYVDGVFLSHPDQDHMNGLLELLTMEDGPKVGALYLPDVGEESRGELEEVQSAAEAADVPVFFLSAGVSYAEGETVFTCLHPESGMTGESNAYSMCMLVEHEGFSLLLTGDVEGEGEEQLTKELLSRGIEQIDVLKVAHHGSKYSTSQNFLDAVNIGTAVISCAKGNSYGHPHEELLQRLEAEGCSIRMTMEEGWICIVP